MKLLQLQAESQAIESTGAQRASAHAAAEASRVESESLVELARKKAQAQKIQMDMELQLENQKNEEQLSHQDAIDQLEVTKAEEMAKIETEKFRRTVKAIGQDTIKGYGSCGAGEPSAAAQGAEPAGLHGDRREQPDQPLTVSVLHWPHFQLQKVPPSLSPHLFLPISPKEDEHRPAISRRPEKAVLRC
eukprot:Sspe_Gene.532::Locus_179_Transcript_2_2_Confidence_0.667_Length_2848::g.532::m.532